METPSGYVAVAKVSAAGERITLHLTPDAVPAAIERGMVRLDGQRTRPDATGYSNLDEGDTDAD